jgi:uncharacterized protein (TIGR02246 family)
MNKRIAVALVALAICTIPAAASASVDSPDNGTESGRNRDLAALQQIRDQQYDAWFAEEGAAFAASFTANADLVTFNGDHLTTRAGIAAGMQYYFDNFIDHTRIKLTGEQVRFVGSELAVIVRTTCLLEPPSTTCRDGSLSRNTNVMVKAHGRWQQESFQNTRVVPLR